MIRLLVTLLLTCEVCLIKASCPDDQEPGFCNGADNHPQLYCPGVDIHVNKWTCSSKNRVRCVCKEGYFRAMNGRCVKDCGLAPPQTEHIPEKPASPKVQDYTYIIPPELDGSPKYLDNAKMFLQNNERIVLVEISKNAWKNSPCVCITSRLIQATESGAKRMIECYKYATLISAPKTIEDQIGTKKLGPFLEIADFEARQQGRTYVSIKEDDAKTQPHSNHVPEKLLSEFTVIANDNRCLLLRLGYARNGKFECMLFGIIGADGIYEAEGTQCQQTKTEWCSTDMQNVWSEECKQVYIKERITDAKALKEKEQKLKEAKAPQEKQSK
uniref:Lipocalin n=1 Tax=Rhipicephalus appendiculatus TaxID=34631 RepID=A0A131YVJ0_RHIAP